MFSYYHQPDVETQIFMAACLVVHTGLFFYVSVLGTTTKFDKKKISVLPLQKMFLIKLVRIVNTTKGGTERGEGLAQVLAITEERTLFGPVCQVGGHSLTHTHTH